MHRCVMEPLLRQHIPQSNDPAMSALHRPVTRFGSVPLDGRRAGSPPGWGHKERQEGQPKTVIGSQ